jgi:hypothetical protein
MRPNHAEWQRHLQLASGVKCNDIMLVRNEFKRLRLIALHGVAFLFERKGRCDNRSTR